VTDRHLPSRIQVDLTQEVREAQIAQNNIAALLKAVIYNGVPHSESGRHGVMVPLRHVSELREIDELYDLMFTMQDDRDLIVQLVPIPARPAPARKEGRFTNVQDVTAIRPVRGTAADRSTGLGSAEQYRAHLGTLDEGGTA
jgi:hypothetical protein